MRFYSILRSRRTKRTIIYGIILLTCASVTLLLFQEISDVAQRNEITIYMETNKKYGNVTKTRHYKPYDRTDISYEKQTYDPTNQTTAVREKDPTTEVREEEGDSKTNELNLTPLGHHAPRGKIFLTDKQQTTGEIKDKIIQKNNPKRGNVMHLKDQEQIIRKEDYEQYKVVFFIGGHKCGSTTLAMYLKHDPDNWELWDPKGQFLHGGKEVCWAMHGTNKEQFWRNFSKRDSKTAIFALDACPFAVERRQFKRMVSVFPNAYYLMSVRDPVERVISHMNIELTPRFRKPLKENIDDYTRKAIISETSRPARLSMFGQTLKEAYSVLPRNKVLIVSNPDLKRQPQQTVDKVMRHIGAMPKHVTLLEANKMKDWDVYQIPSNSTINWLRNMFKQDWEIFKNLSGMNMETSYM